MLWRNSWRMKHWRQFVKFKIFVKLFRFCCLRSFCFPFSKIKYSANLFPSVFGFRCPLFFFLKYKYFFPFSRFLETLLFLMWEYSQLNLIRVVRNLCPMQVVLGSLFPFHIPRQNKFPSAYNCFFVFVLDQRFFMSQVWLSLIIRSLC